MSSPVKPEGAAQPAAPSAPRQSLGEWRDGFYSAPTGEAGDTPGTALPTTAPVQSFWDKLRNGVQGKSRTREILRSIPRGLANVGNSAVQLAAEGGAAVMDGLGIGGTEQEQDARRERAKSARAVSEEDLNMTYGARSDDPIASFAETATQAAGSMILLRGAGLGNIAAGAATDAVAFDPYEAGLSELAAQFGERIPGIGGIVEAAGKLGTVDEQDNFLTSRIKRAVEGGVAGAALDAVVWSAKKVIALRTRNVEAIAEADAKLQDIANGTHTPEGAAVVARPNEDGTWRLDETAPAPREEPTVEPVVEPAVAPVEQTLAQPVVGAGRVDREASDMIDAFRGELDGGEVRLTPEGTPGARIVLHPKGGKVVELRSIENLTGADRSGLATQEMKRLVKLADEKGITLTLQASPFGERALPREALRDFYRKFGFEQTKHGDANMVRTPGAADAGFREVPPAKPAEAVPAVEPEAPAPKFADRAEAEAQANTINHSINARRAAAEARLFTDEQVATHVRTAELLAAAPNGRDFEQLALGTHFNLHYLGGTDRVKAQIEAISEQFQKEFDAAQVKGGIPHELSVKVATKLAKQWGITDWAARVADAAKQGRNAHVELLASNMAVEQLGQQLAKVSKLLTMRPHDPALMADAKELLGVWVNLSRDVAGMNSQAGRNLNILQARSRPDAKGIRFPKDTPPAKPKAPKETTSRQSTSIFDGLTDDEIAAALRQFEYANGNLRNADAVIDGLKVLTDPSKGKIGVAIERSASVFINSLISGAKTMQTIFSSGQAMLFFEYANRTMAGIATLNPKLAREGADMAYAHFAYARDNMQAAAAAFRANRSLIDPSPSMYATGGVVNTVVTLPGRTAGAIDEFTRVTGYRARMRALAARKARDAGLTGDALARRIEEDVRNSIDARTGIGINAEAAEWAGIPTLSNPLGAGTFAGDMSNFLAKYPATKFIVPFIRPGVNTFRYVGKASGGDAIRLLFKESRDVLTKGNPEEAAVMLARTAVAGSLYTYAWYKMMDGDITGRGPSNPTLRNLWLKNHQPYSVKIGDKYYSYRRMEPWGTFLGLAADAHGVQMELADMEGTEGSDIGKAVFASLLANVVNKSYMQGLSTFLKAVDDQDLSSAEKFLGGIAGGFVPQAAQQFNTDVYYREAEGIIEEVMKRTPGFSDNLPPKYNALGEPVMKQGSLWNRNFSIARSADASPSTVEDRLLADQIKISPPPKKFFSGGLDLTDPRYAKNGKLPYVRWMELVSEGFDGEPGLRAKLEELMQPGGEYDSAQEGSKAFPGGERGLIVARVKDSHEMAALHAMLEEYGLTEKYEAFKGMRGASLQDGQAGVDARRAEYGIPTP